MRSVNSARERLKPVVLMLAMLLAMTSRFCSWALMPVAAIASALIASFSGSHFACGSDRHAGDLLIGGDDLVADGEDRLKRALRPHDGFDHLHRRGRALDALDRRGFAGLQRPDCRADRLAERLLETRSLARRNGGLRRCWAQAPSHRADGGYSFDHRSCPSARVLTRLSSRRPSC